MSSPTPTYAAFLGHRRLAAGPLHEVALRAHEARNESEPMLVFADDDGRQVDLDLSGDATAILARLETTESKRSHEEPATDVPRGPGRPKLGVVAREVTLLPRHWDWLAAQPGGASVALRKLVEAARKQEGEAGRARAAREAAYRFMSALGGNLPGFEEASRALFAGDAAGFDTHTARWPEDVRLHAAQLAAPGLA